MNDNRKEDVNLGDEAARNAVGGRGSHDQRNVGRRLIGGAICNWIACMDGVRDGQNAGQNTLNLGAEASVGGVESNLLAIRRWLRDKEHQ